MPQKTILKWALKGFFYFIGPVHQEIENFFKKLKMRNYDVSRISVIKTCLCVAKEKVAANTLALQNYTLTHTTSKNSEALENQLLLKVKFDL